MSDEREIEDYLGMHWLAEAPTDPHSLRIVAEIRRRVGAHARLVAALREIHKLLTERTSIICAFPAMALSEVERIAGDALEELALGGGAQGEHCDCPVGGKLHEAGEPCPYRAQGEAGKEAKP